MRLDWKLNLIGCAISVGWIIAALILLYTHAFAGDWPSNAARGAVGLNLSGKPSTGKIVGVQMPWSATVPANYAAANVAPASQCNCQTAPADGSYVIAINKATRAAPQTPVAEGSCTIAQNAQIGTFASNALYQLSKGDTLYIVAPTADSAAADCHVTIGYGQ